MFRYFLVCFVVTIKHLFNGLANAAMGVAGYLQHYQAQVEAQIDAWARARYPAPPVSPPTVVYESKPKKEDLN